MGSFRFFWLTTYLMIAGRKNARRGESPSYKFRIYNEDSPITEINTTLLSYIPVSPNLPQNHYKIEKTDVLIINELAEKGREKRGWFTCIYHQSCSDLGILV